MTRLLLVAGALGLLTVGDGFLYLVLLDSGGLDARFFPLFYLGTSLVYLALAVPLGRWADRTGRARVFVLGHLALALAFGCGAVPIGGWLPAVAGVALLGLYYATTDGVLAAIAGQVAQAPVRASSIASAQTVVAVARFAASACFGVLWVTIGPQTAILTMGVLLLLVVPPLLLVVVRLDDAPREVER